jgi:chromosomal replication initiation ATPase DnaA
MSNKARQLPLDLGHQPGQSRDHFVVASENAAALNLIDTWPRWTAPVALLVGPPGSGKSHILSIFREDHDAVDSALDFQSALDAAEAGRPIVLDDADAMRLDQTALFHLINAVRSGRASLLMTAQHLPSGWQLTLPDLISRLKTAAVVEIGEPGDMLLNAVVLKLFADRQIEIDPQVVQFITRRIERSLATAIAVVEELDRAALEQRRSITRALAAEVLAAGGREA